jgi:hypothetical protein
MTGNLPILLAAAASISAVVFYWLSASGRRVPVRVRVEDSTAPSRGE